MEVLRKFARSKKWNGSYIKEELLAEEEYINKIFKRKNKSKINQDMIIEYENQIMGTVNAHWFDELSKSLENGIVIYYFNLVW